MDTPEQLRQVRQMWEADQEVRSLVRSDILTYFPEASAGITIGATLANGSTEDACAVSSDKTRFAIADGVSNSYHPRPWAAILVQKWVENPIFSADSDQWKEWLRKPRGAWGFWMAERYSDEGIAILNQNRAQAGFPPIDMSIIGTNLGEVLIKGASATFLGAEVDTKQRIIRVGAVGDSCMLLIHPNSQSFNSFPLTDPSQFNDRPNQIPSSEYGIVGYKEISFSYQETDILVLATDAVSKWLMGGLQESFADTLAKVKSIDWENFPNLVKQERDNHRLAADDSTVMIISLSGNNPTQAEPASRRFIGGRLSRSVESTTQHQSTRQPYQGRRLPRRID